MNRWPATVAVSSRKLTLDWFKEIVMFCFSIAKPSQRQILYSITFTAAGLIALFFPVFVLATTDTDAPELVSVSVDKTSVDVSSGYQLFTFSLEATDASDVAGFKDAYIYFRNVKPDGSAGTGSKAVYFNVGNSNADANGVYDTSTQVGDESVSHKSNQLLVSSGDFDLWELNNIYITDTPGNYKQYYPASFGYGESSSQGSISDNQKNFDTLSVIGGVTDYDAPELVSVSVDKTSVDVSSGYQLFTFSLEATDASDVAGFKDAYIYFRNVKPDGSAGTGSKAVYFNVGNSNADANGVYDTSTQVGDESVSHKSNQLLVSSGDFDLWELNNIYITDTPGNYKQYYPASFGYGESSSQGSISDNQKNFDVLGVITEASTTADLALTASSPGSYLFTPSKPDTTDGTIFSDGVEISGVTIEGSNVWVTGAATDYYTTYPFSIKNNDNNDSPEITLNISGSGWYRAGFNHEVGTSSCYTSALSTENLVTSQKCVISKLGAREVRDFVLTLATTELKRTGQLSISMHASLPEIDFEDNRAQFSFTINRDEDGDGVEDSIDAFPNDSTETKDSDSDGVGDNSDVFPNDNTETLDSDSDGIGNNTDSDDDNDGLSDSGEIALGTNALLRDSDFDTLTDGFENSVSRDALTADYKISSSWAHSCVIHDGGISCWGSDGAGQSSPPDISDALDVDAGGYFSCALRKSGAIVCWGENADSRTPTGQDYISMAVGGYHVCAIEENGSVACFGGDDYGQSTVPELLNPVAVSAGVYHTCALDDSGVVCWGDNEYGQTNVPTLANPTAISSGQDHNCAQDSTGLVCWGRNDNLQADVPSSLPDLVTFDAGGYLNCGIAGGSVTCWNQGWGTSNIPSLTNPVQVSTGSTFACALDDNGVSCWGENGNEGRIEYPSDLYFGDKDLDGLKDDIDTDDDGDGVEDTLDAYPLDATRSVVGSGDGFSFDIDDSGSLSALTDGLLVIRHLFGFTGDTLIASAVDTSARRSTAADISAYLTAAENELDIDGSGDVGALTDGLLLIRYLFDFRGDALISGAIGTGATRTTAEEIESYIRPRLGES